VHGKAWHPDLRGRSHRRVQHPLGGFPGEDLQKCARDSDAPEAPTVTVDNQPVSLTEVTTSVMSVTVPEDNVFGSQDRKGQFAAHGWVTLLNPLKSGTHKIIGPGFTTNIIVQ
jgi:hypothetical protein